MFFCLPWTHSNKWCGSMEMSQSDEWYTLHKLIQYQSYENIAGATTNEATPLHKQSPTGQLRYFQPDFQRKVPPTTPSIGSTGPDNRISSRTAAFLRETSPLAAKSHAVTDSISMGMDLIMMSTLQISDDFAKCLTRPARVCFFRRHTPQDVSPMPMYLRTSLPSRCCLQMCTPSCCLEGQISPQ